jgi:hypothetical protein
MQLAPAHLQLAGNHLIRYFKYGSIDLKEMILHSKEVFPL